MATTEYSVTARLVVEGRTVDLLGIRTVPAHEVDDACQEYRKELRPLYGDGLLVTVDRR